jgi:hypothetical protein
MIWLLTRPLPHTFPPVSSTGDTQRTERETVTDGRGGRKRVGEELNYTAARSLVLYMSFNTLCFDVYWRIYNTED